MQDELQVTTRLLFRLISLVAILAAMGCTGGRRGVLKIADEIGRKELVRDASSLKESAGLLRESDFVKRKLARYSNEEIRRLYKAIGRITFYLPGNRRFVDFQRNTLDELVRRDNVSEHDLRKMYKAYVGARLFDRAARLHEDFPHVRFPFIPKVTPGIATASAGSNNVFEVTDAGKTARLRGLDLAHGPRIVMVMWTGCAVSERALDDILDDARLRPLFRDHGVLLTQRFDSIGVHNWQERFDFSNVYVARDANDFPDFDFLTSPHFYFLKDGKVVYDFDGWKENGGPDSHFLEGLAAAGL
ncbi:MAG: hypothetical protein CO113_14870 [Elusimicrobia bacterium CG_4_9_14_3_um_filter_62_55]|nr:MAG: hypothetical protein COX66_08000 [Elusimicrobia bacterium CG_4_10_14_0_2_um_filter_63_34]PJB24239.1 MAG: hypothetical protein CO113_14870 [Elusimicrobia bacterium CG_4_9_14_3_um_filter_62_55]